MGFLLKSTTLRTCKQNISRSQPFSTQSKDTGETEKTHLEEKRQDWDVGVSGGRECVEHASAVKSQGQVLRSGAELDGASDDLGQRVDEGLQNGVGVGAAQQLGPQMKAVHVLPIVDSFHLLLVLEQEKVLSAVQFKGLEIPTKHIIQSSHVIL